VEAGAQRAVAFVQEFPAFEEDCRRAVVVVTRLEAPSSCKAAVVLDRKALAERGATAIRLGVEAAEIRSVKKGREVRPWTTMATAQTIHAEERPRLEARPVPEQDLPEDAAEDEISTGEPD
jgi:competence protein ComEC